MTSDTQNNPNKSEQHATVGDLVFAVVVALMVTGFIYSVSRLGPAPAKKPIKTTINLDSLVQDSLEKTVEYQNAVRATQELEAKKSELQQHFNSKILKH